MPVAFQFAPKNWLTCQGQILPIAQNTALFSLLGTMYGGNGTTTFALPDLQGRAIIGAGQGPGLPLYNIGQKAGAINVTLNASQMPAHNHLATVHANAFSATSNDPANNYFGGSGPDMYNTATNNSVMNASAMMATPVGGNQPVDIQNPYLGLYYVICQFGIFPPRG
ncbi:MAG: tail fiber protein [Taibaiella sp.]|nr:tail fiber protein [Taibaiella sp.]